MGRKKKSKSKKKKKSKGTSVFGSAAEEKKGTKKKKKDDNVVVITDRKLRDDIIRLIEVEDKLAAFKAEKDILKKEINQKGRDQYLQKYAKEGAFPGSSLKLRVKDGKKAPAKCVTVVQDNYAGVDEDKAEKLEKKYGDIVEKEETFQFNSEMLEKHKSTIDKLFKECDEIPEEDKAELLKKKVTYNIKKGTVKKLHDISSKKDLKEAVQDIRPTIYTSNFQVPKSK